MGNLSTPGSVQKLQRALHAKAKAEPGFRFYALYDKIYREDILAHAYAQCRANKGAPGVDGQDFADVEAYGRERWLGELALALSEESYRPEPIRRVFIPKANGKLRPLGIPTLRDRVCMTAAMLVLEPIFEADLPPEQYAYRPGRNAQQAVVEVEEVLFRSHPNVVDADLSDYFGSIPHAELLKSVARRVVDRRVLHLIRQWLECPVEETDGRGRKRRTTVAKDSRCGIPQGSPISPLLANLYMRRFVLAWKQRRLEQRLGSRIVIYADDLVILCKRGKAEEALLRMREIMGQLPSTGPGIHEKTLMTPLGVQAIQHLDGTGVERHRPDPFGLRVQCRNAPHPIAPIDVLPACPKRLIETRPCGQQEERDQTDVAEPRAVLLQHTHQPLQLLGVQVPLGKLEA